MNDEKATQNDVIRVYNLAQEAEAALNDVVIAIREARKSLQDSCPHPASHVLHCPQESYHSCEATETLCPVRVCKICGYSEKGWNFNKLAYEMRDVEEVSRGELFKHVLE